MISIEVDGVPYLTLENAAAATGYKVSHLRRLASNGSIKAKKMVSVWIVNLDSLRDYIAEKPQRKPHKN